MQLPEQCQEPWAFPSLDFCFVTADKPVPFAFLLCHVTWADAKGSGMARGLSGHLSMASLTAGFPASAYLPSLGANPSLTTEGIFLLFFHHYCFSSICPMHSF
jgi:hypothetical protein